MTASVRPQALLIDYGGVLTPPMGPGFLLTCEHHGVPADEFLSAAFGPGMDEQSPFHLIETGVVGRAEFEELLAPVLSELAGRPVDATSFMAEAQQRCAVLHQPMSDAVRDLHVQVGMRLALVSNSWDTDGYDWSRMPEFDHRILSGEIGVRKPDGEFYELTLSTVGLPAEVCLFVDDNPINLEPARNGGMQVWLHEDMDSTMAHLQSTFLDG